MTRPRPSREWVECHHASTSSACLRDTMVLPNSFLLGPPIPIFMSPQHRCRVQFNIQPPDSNTLFFPSFQSRYDWHPMPITIYLLLIYSFVFLDSILTCIIAMLNHHSLNYGGPCTACPIQYLQLNSGQSLFPSSFEVQKVGLAPAERFDVNED
ncbi:hypothetical protein B0H16DRAFT_1624217 [Mycena metata]|uniref:Uncharacterized protein n=1 Tax=Mycena metata TaxID=1033252 RepID=A0AAD7H542_9AGAR|nr:hypothetical protein B0H16DRAFT_1624217 [Mycena metata]